MGFVRIFPSFKKRISDKRVKFYDTDQAKCKIDFATIKLTIPNLKGTAPLNRYRNNNIPHIIFSFDNYLPIFEIDDMIGLTNISQQ